MDQSQLINDYLMKARDDIRLLDPFYATARMNGQFQIQLREGERLREEMITVGSPVVLPLLRAVPAKLRNVRPNAVLTEGFVLGYGQTATANARDLVETLGAAARRPLIEGTADSSAVVRALSAHFLAFKNVEDAGAILRVEQLFSSEPIEVARIAAGVTLLVSEHTTENGWESAMSALVAWADRQVPGWKRLGRDAVDALPIAFIGLMPGLLIEQSRAE
jgi:hypothetical protein